MTEDMELLNQDVMGMLVSQTENEVIENLQVIFREYITEQLRIEYPNVQNFYHGDILFDPLLNKEIYFPNIESLNRLINLVIQD